MHRVSRSQQENKRTAGIGVDEESAQMQFSPRHPLANEKPKAQNRRHTEPRELIFRAERNSRNRLYRRESHLSRQAAPRELDRNATRQQQNRVDTQQPPRQIGPTP